MAQKIIIEDMVKDSWKGYTFEEMRYRRALAYTKKEIEKERLINRSRTIFTQVVPAHGVGGTILNKITSKISMIDYLIIGFKLSSKIIAIWKKLKKRNS